MHDDQCLYVNNIKSVHHVKQTFQMISYGFLLQCLYESFMKSQVLVELSETIFEGIFAFLLLTKLQTRNNFDLRRYYSAISNKRSLIRYWLFNHSLSYQTGATTAA